MYIARATATIVSLSYPRTEPWSVTYHAVMNSRIPAKNHAAEKKKCDAVGYPSWLATGQRTKPQTSGRYGQTMPVQKESHQTKARHKTPENTAERMCLCMKMILQTLNLLTEQQKPRRAEILRMGRTIVCNSQCAVHLVLSLTRACMSELTNLFSAPRTRLRSTRSNGLGRHCKTLKPHRQPDAETSFHSSSGTKCAGMQVEMSCSSDNKSQLPPSHQSPWRALSPATTASRCSSCLFPAITSGPDHSLRSRQSARVLDLSGRGAAT